MTVVSHVSISSSWARPQHIVAGNLLVYASAPPTSAGIVDKLAKRLSELGVEHPAGVGYVHVISARRLQQGRVENAQQAWIEAGGAVPKHLQAVLIVLERQGFGAATIRALAAGVLRAARFRVPVTIVGSAAAGVPWLVRKLAACGAATGAAQQLPGIVRQLQMRNELAEALAS